MNKVENPDAVVYKTVSDIKEMVKDGKAVVNKLQQMMGIAK